ncbi:MAG: FecR domain-containing protein [Acidobacteria bacterium]|nr:FecR domain-containing protein [Acidobacteriota bacterium]
MRQFKKTSLLSLLALAFVCTCGLSLARADAGDLRVISARAGGVNLVAGDVRVRRAASADWATLSTADELKSGDTVRTGSAGRVEILLNPGSYFRAGVNTEFTLASADLNDLRVEIARGSAVVEAMGYGDGGTSVLIDVAMPDALVKIVRSGVYRFNAQSGAPAEVSVAKGRALVGSMVIKGGKLARVSGDTAEVVKLDKKWRDDLDQWSRDRGKELAKANERVNRRALRDALSAGSFNNIFGRRNDPFGLWYYSAATNCYTFLPFGWGWRSPYGYGYGLGLWRPYPDPSAGWIPAYVPPASGGSTAYNPGGGSTGGGNTGGGGYNPGGGGRDYTPMTPTPVTSPSSVSPMERPTRERSIEPGSRPNQN